MPVFLIGVLKGLMVVKVHMPINFGFYKKKKKKFKISYEICNIFY